MTHSRRECNEGENRMMMLLNKIFMDENNLEVLFFWGGKMSTRKHCLPSGKFIYLRHFSWKDSRKGGS